MAEGEIQGIGALPIFDSIGLSVDSHQKPQFSTSENEFVIKLKTLTPVKMAAKILNIQASNESRENVFIQTQDGRITILVSLPNIGYHKLQLYALPRDTESNQLPNVFNYVINCTATPRKSRVFPKQFSQWRDGCTLYEPFSLSGDRATGDISFRVRIPDALAVAVTVDEEWFHLEPADDDGLWQGKVKNIERFKGRDLFAVINANLDIEDETKYASILQYAL